jgi:hypothetical protein
MKYLALSAFVGTGVVLLAAEPTVAQMSNASNMSRPDGLIIKVQRRCWRYQDCARRCRNEWRNYNWSSAEDCIRNFPCSQYPRSC